MGEPDPPDGTGSDGPDDDPAPGPVENLSDGFVPGGTLTLHAENATDRPVDLDVTVTDSGAVLVREEHLLGGFSTVIASPVVRLDAGTYPVSVVLGPTGETTRVEWEVESGAEVTGDLFVTVTLDGLDVGLRTETRRPGEPSTCNGEPCP